MTKWKASRWVLLFTAMIALVSLAAAACGSGDDDGDKGGTNATSTGGNGGSGTAPSDGGQIDYSKLSGAINIDGSSTVYPISQALSEEFAGDATSVRVSVAFSGTGGGFEKFCRGETDISNASRPIKDSEKQACEAAGIKPVELKIATDALTVVVNPNNDWARCMTTEQLANVFRKDGAKKWSDINPSWPNENIELFYPGPDSGTFDYFNEVIEGVNKAYVHADDGTASEDDNLLVRGVEGNKNAIGYFGLAYYLESGKNLNAVAIDHGAGCVAPSVESARESKYVPLSRPLFMYTSEAALVEKPQVLGFLSYYYEHAEELVTDVGYVPLDDSTLAAQQATLGGVQK